MRILVQLPKVHPEAFSTAQGEPDIYGTTRLAEIEAMCRKTSGSRPIAFRQTNAEHRLVEWIHEANAEHDQWHAQQYLAERLSIPEFVRGLSRAAEPSGSADRENDVPLWVRRLQLEPH